MSDTEVLETTEPCPPDEEPTGDPEPTVEPTAVVTPCAAPCRVNRCVTISTGATTGAPGAFTPAASATVATPTAADLTTRHHIVTASPATAWTAGQYVVTRDGVHMKWNGTAWVAG